MMLPHQPFIVDEKMYKKYEGKLGNPNHESKEISDYHPYIQWWKRRTELKKLLMKRFIGAGQLIMV